jgi:hypothetical protein
MRRLARAAKSLTADKKMASSPRGSPTPVEGLGVLGGQRTKPARSYALAEGSIPAPGTCTPWRLPGDRKAHG